MEVEEISDEDRMFYRIPQKQLGPEGIHEGVFRDRRGDGMSVDWEKYSTAQQTRERGRLDADEYGIVAFVAGQVRAIRVPPLSVVHHPVEGNQAHSHIHGINGAKDMARLKLFRLVKGWEIPPGPANN